MSSTLDSVDDHHEYDELGKSLISLAAERERVRTVRLRFRNIRRGVTVVTAVAVFMVLMYF